MPGIVGLVHDPHASATQLLQYSIVRNGLADHEAIILIKPQKVPIRILGSPGTSRTAPCRCC